MKHIFTLTKTAILTCIMMHVTIIQGFSQNLKENNNTYESQSNFWTTNKDKIENTLLTSDSDFFKLLQNNWIQVDSFLTYTTGDNLKPENLNVITQNMVVNNNINLGKPIEIDKFEDLSYIATPFAEKDAPTNYQAQNTEFMFFGNKVVLKYNKALHGAPLTDMSEQVISAWWKTKSELSNKELIEGLLAYKAELQLSDWGYFLLVKNAASVISPDNTNEANLLTWFIMLKSKYNVKIGFDNTDTYLLLASDNKIFGKPYITSGNLVYYIEGNPKKIKTYSGNHSDVVFPVNASITKPLNFKAKPDSVLVKFDYKSENYSFYLKFDKNIINFYHNYPQINLSAYFNSAVSTLTKQSVLEKISPLLKNRSETEAVGFLLALVQKGFNYQTDKTQFGAEKYFFPEEVLAYPYSDCEDRSVFFTYLVNQLLNIDVIGLKFPSHVATGVRFKSTVSGDFINYQSKKYVICDPSYINAPLGYLIPDVNKNNVQIIDPNNKNIRFSFGELKNNMFKKGLYATKINTYEVNNESYILATGFFNETVTVANKRYTSSGGTDLFVARFTPDGEIVWFDIVGGLGEDKGQEIALVNNAIIVTGLYTKPFEKEGVTVRLIDSLDLFIAQYNLNGEFAGINSAELSWVPLRKSYVYSLAFTNQLEVTSSKIYENNEFFSSYGITKQNNQNLLVGLFPLVGFEADNETDEVKTRSLYTSENFFPSGWNAERTKLLTEQYEKTIAGLVAFFIGLKSNGNVITGEKIINQINKEAFNIRANTPTIYENLRNIKTLKNSGGIITLNTKDGKDLVLDVVTIQNNAKFQITTYRGGNTLITIISGMKIGQSYIQFGLNNMKLLKSDGDIIFDFDAEHSLKRVNLAKDILKRH